MRKGILSLVLFICLLLSETDLMSQTVEIDSLQEVIKTQELSEEKVDNILVLSDKFGRIDVDKCLEYATKALTLSNKLDYTKGQSNALRLFALSDYYKGNFESALEYGVRSLDLAESINDQISILRAANIMSAIYNLKAKNDKSIEYLMFAYGAAQELNDTTVLISLLQNLGYLHKEENNIVESTKYYQKISTFKIHNGSTPLFKSQYYLGSGIYYRSTKNYEKAISLFLKGIPITENAKNFYGLSAAHEELGKTYKEIKSLDKAEYHFKEAMKGYKTIGADEQYLYIVSGLTKLYNEMNKPELAVKFGTDAMDLANELNVIHDQSNLSLELATAHEKLGHIPIALAYQKDHKKWSDSVSSSAKDEIILKMESDYQLSLLEKKQLKNEAIIKEEKQKNYIYILLLMLASIATLFYWINFKTKEKYSKTLEREVEERTKDLKLSNEELSIANSELERFAYISAHDLKEHIRNIGSFSSLLEREIPEIKSSAGKSSTYFDVIKNSTISMSQLVEDTLQYVSIKKENIDQDVNLNLIVDNIRNRKASSLEPIKGVVESENLPTIKANNQHINLLFTELIENGFKFNDQSEPYVKISYSETESEHNIDISDNGIGLDDIYSKQAFTMFTRFHNRSEYQGSGLGLAIVNKIINLLNGQVTIHNRDEGGTMVKLRLPKV